MDTDVYHHTINSSCPHRERGLDAPTNGGCPSTSYPGEETTESSGMERKSFGKFYLRTQNENLHAASRPVLSETMEMFYFYRIQYSRHSPHVAIEHGHVSRAVMANL